MDSTKSVQQSLYNQAINLYLKEGDILSALQVAKEHFQVDVNFYLGLLVNSGDFEAAQSKLQEIASDEKLKEVASFYQVLVELGKNEKTIMDLGKDQEAKLMEVAKGESAAKYAAQNILSFTKGYVFERPVEVWITENLQGEVGDRSAENTLSENPANNWLSLSPNPTSGTVEVRWNPSEGTGTLEVFNMSGMRLLQQQVALENGVNQLSLVNQSTGIYLVRLRSSTGSITRKLIIE